MQITMNILAYFLIPAYTVLFTQGYGWFTTNFSVIGNIMDKKLAFLTWGVMVGLYFYLVYRSISKHVSLKPLTARLIPAALLLLFFAITTPYLPDELPLKSFLHIVFAFVSTVLLLAFLLSVCWQQYQLAPQVYRLYLAALAVIVVISAALLALAGIVRSGPEIFLTNTSVIFSRPLAKRAGH